jgi:hypothetical protein
MPAVRYYLVMLRLVLAFSTLAGLAVQAQPSTDTLKQVLTRRLLSLKLGATTERNVLYQEVRAGTGNAFQVTALIRDYDPGYPPNHYYGQTCVGHLDKVRFTLSKDEFGGWDVQGAMTPPMDTRQCKPNTAAGVSSIPLSSLSGSSAPAGNPVASATRQTGDQPAGTGSVAAGSYECWANGQARMLLNFTIRSASQYTGSDGKPGAYSYNAGSGRLTFRGGSLDGALPDGFQAIYHVPQGLPTVSFRSPRGSEAAFCQKVR